MQESRVAIRYAKPLLQLAQERGVLEFLVHDMDLFSKVCAENHAFVLTLKSPIIGHDKKLAILRKLFDGKVNPLTLSIFELICRKNREAYLPEIASAFKTLYKEQKGILSAQVTTTFPLNDELRNQLKDMITKSFGKDVDLKESVDKELIGGFVLQVGDKQIDESVKSKIQRLKNKFKDNSYVAKY